MADDVITPPAEPPQAVPPPTPEPVVAPALVVAPSPTPESALPETPPPASAPAPTSSPASTPAPTPSASETREKAAKGRATIQAKKRAKLERIMAEVVKKGAVTNDDVEKLLHISDATATRHLAQLVKEGLLRKTGSTGKRVKYVKS